MAEAITGADLSARELRRAASRMKDPKAAAWRHLGIAPPSRDSDAPDLFEGGT